ncbi:ABC transporter ATP-binding protein [uncultured Desulfobacter sp.]|uniref:ABC transporter ATP-binding protein n=1 Tax=uncultured Desulfobacter sp. TaxID=240139 RepID=UPI002AAA7A4B|nr:ABC transporter ATP-binding protein [uncultured Desulfobacter sp.]
MSDTTSEGYAVLWRIIRPVNKYIYSAMGLAALGSMATIVTLLMLSLTVAVLIKGTQGLLFYGISWTITTALAGVGVFGVLAFCLTMAGFGVSHLGAFYLEEDLRTRLSKHLAQLPLGFIITTGTGALKKVMLEDVKNLHVFVADSTPTFGRGYTAPLVTLVLLFVIDWRLACIALGVMLMGMFVMCIAMRDMKTMQEKYENSQGRINAAVIEFIQAMPVVRTFDDGTSSFKRYLKALDRYRQVYIEWIKISGTPARTALVLLAPLPTILAVLAGGIYFVNAGTLSLPSLIAVLFLSTGMVDAFMQLMWLNNFLRKSKAAANRIEALLSIPAMPVAEKPFTPENMTICFDNVDFRYETRKENALTDVNFVVEPGTTTALVGPSGAGKSTVAKLLPRFWDVTGGRITIGGIDIRQMDNEDLMNTVTFVFQDTYLFHDTLGNNIRMAKPDATDEMVIAASQAAQIHDFIASLPNGYDTLAGDRGTRLSGGQRQRITIARAILRDAPVVVLDEATAFADPESEEEIIKAIACLTKNKTVITIAHRLSTITHVDQILVFDKGRIVEQGTHGALLSNNGLYARLWANYEAAQLWNLHAKGAVNE